MLIKKKKTIPTRLAMFCFLFNWLTFYDRRNGALQMNYEKLKKTDDSKTKKKHFFLGKLINHQLVKKLLSIFYEFILKIRILRIR